MRRLRALVARSASRSAADRAERMLTLVVTTARLAALTGSVAVRLPGDPRGVHYTPLLVLIAVTAAATVAVGIVCLIQGRIRGWTAGVDTACVVTLLHLGAQGQVTGRPSDNMLYDFSIAAVLLAGAAAWPAAAAAAAASSYALVNLVTSAHVGDVNEPLWNAIPNSLTYLGVAAVTAVIARSVRGLAAALDTHRAMAVQAGAELARAQQRMRDGALLSRRLRPIMAELARADLPTDIKAQIHRERTWLHRIVADDPPAADLVSGLTQQVAARRIDGLSVELNLLNQPPPLAADQLAALLDATREALTNVAKHSGASSAQVSVEATRLGVTVTITDAGRGYDAVTRIPGFGQRESILARMRAVGGRASIASDPGQGTVVRLWAPSDRVGSQRILGPEETCPGPAATRATVRAVSWYGAGRARTMDDQRSWSPARLADDAVLRAAVTLRVASALIVIAVVPMVWPRLSYPFWSTLLAASLAAMSFAIARRCIAQRRVSPGHLYVELPAVAAALLASAVLHSPIGVAGWTDFAFPYAVQMSFAIGLSCQNLWAAVGCGQVWALAAVIRSMGIDGASFGTSVLAVPAFVVGPVAAGLGACLARRAATELAAIHELEAAHARKAAATAQRRQHARAVHDRVLQTLETLSRGDYLTDSDLRRRTAEQAAWLRRHIEQPADERSREVSAALAETVERARPPDLRLKLLDAGLRLDPGRALGPPQREALLDAIRQLVADQHTVRGITVHASWHGDGILVSIVAPGARLNTRRLSELNGRLARAGGHLSEMEPSVEVWVPSTAPTPTGRLSTGRH